MAGQLIDLKKRVKNLIFNRLSSPHPTIGLQVCFLSFFGHQLHVIPNMKIC